MNETSHPHKDRLYLSPNTGHGKIGSSVIPKITYFLKCAAEKYIKQVTNLMENLDHYSVYRLFFHFVHARWSCWHSLPHHPGQMAKSATHNWWYDHTSWLCFASKITKPDALWIVTPYWSVTPIYVYLLTSGWRHSIENHFSSNSIEKLILTWTWGKYSGHSPNLTVGCGKSRHCA